MKQINNDTLHFQRTLTFFEGTCESPQPLFRLSLSPTLLLASPWLSLDLRSLITTLSKSPESFLSPFVARDSLIILCVTSTAGTAETTFDFTPALKSIEQPNRDWFSLFSLAFSPDSVRLAVEILGFFEDDDGADGCSRGGEMRRFCSLFRRRAVILTSNSERFCSKTRARSGFSSWGRRGRWSNGKTRR
jgi:hypothetical protein